MAEEIESRVIKALQTRRPLSEMELAKALRLAKERGEPGHQVLQKLGLISDQELARALAEVTGLPLCPDEIEAEDSVKDLREQHRFLKDSQLLPLRREQERLEIAMANPLDQHAMQAMAMATGCNLNVCIGPASRLEAAIDRFTAQSKTDMAESDASPFWIGDPMDISEEDIERLRDLASEGPVIRKVNDLLKDAVESRVSDLHLEPFSDALKVRYRIDGVLRDQESLPIQLAPAIVSRVKIMAKLNIAERRLPQDGRIALRIQGRDLDLRISTVPTLHGENLVIRLLDQEAVSLDLDALGFSGQPLDRLLAALSRPGGILLVTGPTGCGKSTTLYAGLKRLNTGQQKIITVEDPIEYELPGINQIQIKKAIGMTFAQALRAILRQDPDIIMIGEMRDLETARIAVQSAMTGHLVLSTLHTRDAASGLTRLLEMGIEDYLIASTVTAILAQRLVRVLCRDCRKPIDPGPDLLRLAGQLMEPAMIPSQVYRAGGCPACQGTGYRGRTVIAEVLSMTDELRSRVLETRDSDDIRHSAMDAGMRTLYQDGLLKVLAGLTSVEELSRVTEEL